jgi:hypothetical protein
VAPYRTSRGISDAQLVNEFGIMQTSVVEIVQSFAVPIELALVKTNSFPKSVIFGRLRHGELLAYVRESSMEREIEGKLDKANEVAATATTVAVKDIFGCIDVEGRSTFGM